MRRLITFVVALMVAASSALIAQKVMNPEQLDATMKKIGAAQGATGKAIKSGAFADAKTSVATVKQALMDAENFWVMNKKDDAVKMSKDAIAKVTALETALSAAAPDQAAAFAALKEVGGTCTACHMTYRVQDEATKQYSLKPGTI